MVHSHITAIKASGNNQGRITAVRNRERPGIGLFNNNEIAKPRIRLIPTVETSHIMVFHRLDKNTGFEIYLKFSNPTHRLNPSIIVASANDSLITSIMGNR